MGVATSIALIGGVASAYQAYQGAEQASAAESALNNLKIPVLKNPAEGMQVSTLGADLQRQEAARLSATSVQALQGAGVRGVVGGVGAVQAQNQLMNQQIAADLDRQQKEIDRARAEYDMQLQGMEERRYMGNVAALSSQINQGNQMFQAGLGGIAQSAMGGLRAYAGKQSLEGASTGADFSGKPIDNTPIQAPNALDYAKTQIPTMNNGLPLSTIPAQTVPQYGSYYNYNAPSQYSSMSFGQYGIPGFNADGSLRTKN